MIIFTIITPTIKTYFYTKIYLFDVLNTIKNTIKQLIVLFNLYKNNKS